MEDMKKQINYKLEKNKKDLKNNMPYITDPTQKLQYLNASLNEIYNTGLVKKDVGICNTIIKYWEEQGELEDQIVDLQKTMVKYMDNILEHLMREL